jgi:hypothetical protein
MPSQYVRGKNNEENFGEGIKAMRLNFTVSAT